MNEKEKQKQKQALMVHLPRMAGQAPPGSDAVPLTPEQAGLKPR